MTKFEYTSVAAQGRKGVVETFVEQLNEHGELGWEVCGVSITGNAAVAILMRPLEEEPSTEQRPAI